MATLRQGPRRIYLDHAATTPVRKEVFEAMVPFLSGSFGNPSSLHEEGRTARDALEQAREAIRRACGASRFDFLFCSGGTEANNAAIVGLLLAEIERARAASAKPRRRVVTSAIEHSSVLNVRPLVEAFGGAWSETAPSASGRVETAAIESALDEDTLVVSLVWANNEVGALQPVSNVAEVARLRGVLCHTDLVQALGKLPIDLDSSGCDLATVSAHKVCGPKGSGGLFVRRGVPWRPFLRGGSQEGGLRAGTESVASAVGFARAVELALLEREDRMACLGRWRDRLRGEIERRWARAVVNTPRDAVLPTILNVSFPWVEGESLVRLLDWHGIAASTGSACNVGAKKPSHVLKAMGRSDREVRGSLRLSLGHLNEEADVDATLEALEQALSQLEGLAPR